MLTDPVADMLTRIRNANKALHDRAEMPNSKLKTEIARILKEEGYIRDYHVAEAEGKPHKTLVIEPSTAAAGAHPDRPQARPSPAGGSTPARTAASACSAVWASRSCPPRAASSRAAPPNSRASAAKSPASFGNPELLRTHDSYRQKTHRSACRRARRGRSRPCHGLRPEGRAPSGGASAHADRAARGVITVTRPTERGEDRALHGLTRTLIANMVEGVTNGFEKRLEIQGVGYRAALSGSTSSSRSATHSVKIKPRQGIEFEVPIPTQVIVRGIDKQVVGQTAAEIRKVRPPEPYKGKGIRYEAEYVRRKVGKRA